MQFSIVAILAVFSTGALAAPASLYPRQTCDIKSALNFLLSPWPYIYLIITTDCFLDLAPTGVSCVAAAAQGELGASLLFSSSLHIYSPYNEHPDIVSDGGCLIAAAKDVVDLPASCTGCAAQLGITLPSASSSGVVGSIESGLESAGNAVTSGLSSLGSDIEGLF
jgi:hypothetical protein